MSEPLLLERRAPARGWVGLRAVLALVALVLSGWALLSHPAEASLQALYDDVRAGKVEVVRLEEGLPPGASGSAQQDVRWRTGLRVWQAPVTVVRGDVGLSDDGREQTSDNVETELRRIDPALRIEEVPRTSGWSVTTGGVQLTGPAALAVLVAGLAGMVLLVAGPKPWRATRWAWFWLSPLPGGALAFLLLSGPTPGLPRPTDPERRLTGGKAFLLALLLGAVAAGLAQLLWAPRR